MDSNRDFTLKQERSLDIFDILTFLWRKKFRIVITAGLLASFGAYYVIHLPKIYVASSILLLSAKDSGLTLPSSLSAITSGEDTRQDTYIEFMRSRQFVQTVVDDLALYNLHEYQQSTDGGYVSEKDYATTKLLNQFSVSKLSNTDMLKITVESLTPSSAAEIANHIGPAFFAYYALINRQKADSKSQWLNDQLNELKNSLSQSEERLLTFLRDNELVNVESQVELAKSEIAGLISQKIHIDRAVAESQGSMVQLATISGGQQDYLQIPAIQNNALIRDLRIRRGQQQLLMEGVTKRYLHKHPKYIAAKAGLEAIDTEFTMLINQLVNGLRSSNETLKARQRQILAQIQETKERHANLGKHSMQISRMQREIESTQHLYEMFLSRLQETEILKDLDDGDDFAIVDSASEPTFPAKPKVVMGIALSVIFSCVFSFGFWLILHLVSDKYTRFKSMLSNLDVPILSMVPRIKQTKANKGKPFALSMHSEGERNYQYFEAIRSLRTGLLVKNNQHKNAVIAVTSIGERDGKSEISTSLADSFSRMEKTLLIDVDLRQPKIGEMFDIDANLPGLTSFLGNKSSFSKCIHAVHSSPLILMPSGPLPPDPLAYISKPRFAAFLHKLRGYYERVVIETPPINTVSDAIAVGKFVDGVIVVCDAEKNEGADLLLALQRVHEAELPLLGVVFNRVKDLRSNMNKRQGLVSRLKRAFGIR
ncbi:MAG: chain-length determining protein [Alteromonadaceae bacterium]|jgi:receptor protein-tyrosine kinase|nr:chain-length determining protein [Alteromonadaceae bacterium]MBB19822.1 chain-length determining protein [Rickettsiales bacterium]